MNYGFKFLGNKTVSLQNVQVDKVFLSITWLQSLNNNNTFKTYTKTGWAKSIDNKSLELRGTKTLLLHLRVLVYRLVFSVTRRHFLTKKAISWRYMLFHRGLSANLKM